MRPTLFTIGSIPIRGYGLMVAIGFLVAIFVASHRAKKQGISSQDISDLGFYILISAMLGARFFHYFQHLDEYGSFWSVFKVWEGGLAYYGGFILALAVGVIYLYQKKLPIGKFLDVLSPCMILGLSIGRIGCFMAGCCFGKETSLPWGIPVRWTLLDSSDINLYLHPTQLYSSISLFIIFLILINIQKYMKFPGQLFLFSVISYSIFRFLIDFIRYYSIEERIGILATSQFISIITGITSLAFMIVILMRKKYKVAAGLSNNRVNK